MDRFHANRCKVLRTEVPIDADRFGAIRPRAPGSPSTFPPFLHQTRPFTVFGLMYLTVFYIILSLCCGRALCGMMKRNPGFAASDRLFMYFPVCMTLFMILQAGGCD
jgi:hypothetical protein